MQNRDKLRNNTSGHTGIYWVKRMNRWWSTHRKDGKTQCLGYYADIKDAIAAREDALSMA